jgi:hypothetical protein
VRVSEGQAAPPEEAHEEAAADAGGEVMEQLHTDLVWVVMLLWLNFVANILILIEVVRHRKR